MRRTLRAEIAVLSAVLSLLALLAPDARAQLTDQTQTPNPAGAGILKSFEQEIGTGVGDVMTPGSSIFLIERDPARAIQRGRQIFQRKFTVAQGFGPRTHDGSGDIAMDGSLGAGLVDSCAGCHARPRGSAGFGGDVFTRPDSRDAPHLFGLGLQEMLGDEITADLRAIRAAAVAEATRRGVPVERALVSKGIRYGRIRALADGRIDTRGVEGVDPDLRVRPFFAHGGTISIREFAVGAFKNEMGLQAVDPLLSTAAAGGRVVTPAGMVLDGALDKVEKPPAASASDDPDGDGVRNEIPTAIVDFMEFYLLNYFEPATYRQTRSTRLGLAAFRVIGCDGCHVQNLTIEHDRRVATVETRYDRARGIFNNLFATVTPQITESDDHSGFPTLKRPAGGRYVVENLFADMKRHDLGPAFHERNFDGTLQTQFMTEPLWGVGTSAPYGHDGRSINLREVILRHGGEAQSSRDGFAALPESLKVALVDFLESLVLFPPDDTASNLDPGDPSTPGFPQKGHGSIKLGVLFDDPSEGE
jgi:hypothetical protein